MVFRTCVSNARTSLHVFVFVFVFLRVCLPLELFFAMPYPYAAAFSHSDSPVVASTTKDEISEQRRRGRKKLILLDRDGVINEDVGDPGVLSPKDLKLTYNAAESISKLRRNENVAGVAVVTNQSCVGKNLISLEELDDIHLHLKNMLTFNDNDCGTPWDQIYKCTISGRRDNFAYETFRRKPNPGMLLEAMSDFDMSPEDCVMIGDSVRDLEAAANAGVQLKILVRTGYGSELLENSTIITPGWFVSKEDCPDSIPHSVLPFLVAENLSEAIQWLFTNKL